MASPIPKPAALRQRRNRTSTAAAMEAPPATKVDLPRRFSTWNCIDCELPGPKHRLDEFADVDIDPHDFTPAPQEWRPATERWWNTVWESPMAAEWVDADVPGLLAVALLVDEFWTFGDVRLAAEIRMQQREFGLSPLARRQLQWEVKRVEAATKTTPRSPTTRRLRRDPRAVLRVIA